MELKNFDVSSSIALQSGELLWDLHNFADFDTLELLPTENSAVLRWRVPSSVSNPWGCRENKFAGVELLFRNLTFLHVGPRDEDMPVSEDTCVAEIFKVDPTIAHEQPHMRQMLERRGSFRLAFSFQSGRVIEIESETVELIPLRK